MRHCDRVEIIMLVKVMKIGLMNLGGSCCFVDR